MRISDWSSDVCSSDLGARACRWTGCGPQPVARVERLCDLRWRDGVAASGEPVRHGEDDRAAMAIRALYGGDAGGDGRSGAGNSAGRDGLCAGRRCPDAESRRDIVFALAGAVAGGVTGSFLATLIFRWPHVRSVVTGRWEV